MRKRTDGYCIVSTRTACTFHLRRDQYSPVRRAWLDGAVFVDTTGLHGEAITIKLTDVDGIYDCSPDAVMSEVEEKRADASDDSLATGTA